MALIAVAVVGLSHSASADVDGKIYVTNVASGMTTESPAPSGLTTASTVYATYEDDGVRDIVENSDYFKVTVVDPDENDASPIVEDAAAGNGYNVQCAQGSGCDDGGDPAVDVVDANVTNLIGTGFDAAGEQVQVTLDDSAGSPIIGGVDTISVVLASDDETEVAGVTVKAINFAGDTNNDAIITIGIDYGTGPTGPVTFLYNSSAVEDIQARVTSIVDPEGALVTLRETDRNTGRFEGWVKIEKHVVGDLEDAEPADGSGGLTQEAPLTIPAIGGPITIKYTDVENANGTSSTRTATVFIDTTPPTATISSPSTDSETQNRKPTFTGNVSDHQSGINVGSFGLYIDQTDDAGNDDAIIDADSGEILADSVVNGVAGNLADIDTDGLTDGVKTMAFSHTPSSGIPGEVGSNPDHTVDFQVRVADVAGNYAYSDSDTSDDEDGRLGNKPHTVKIDQIIPQMDNAYAGVGYDADADADDTFRDSIKVAFDGKLNAASISASDFKITLSGAGGVFVPAKVLVKGSVVYLDLDSTIPSDNTPTVALQGTIQDLAGNSTSAGSAVAEDDLPPVLTVTRSGGTGTGTGAEGPDSLTSGSMTVTVSSDEDLSSPPEITVTNLGGDGVGDVLDGAPGIAQGGNVWKFTIAGGGANVNRAISIEATDIALNVTPFGSDSVKAYTVDTAVAEPTSSPEHEGDTTQSNPFITTDYDDDQSTLTVVSATLDDVDVTSSVVASANKKKFFFQPTTALSNGDHTYVIKVKDAAGNEETTTTTFTKASRTDFVITLFAGWNAISVPSNPLDDSIGSVFSNAGVKQVVAYDASTPAQPWRIASKVDGSFSSQTNPGLTSVNAGHGYWVETTDFENQKVALEGPTSPGDARPGLTTIATGNGWNFVGVVDQSRNQTQGGDEGEVLIRPVEGAGSDDADGNPIVDEEVDYDSYFSSVNVQRSYTFNTVTSEFQIKNGSDDVNIGAGIWAFISPQENGKLPHIVP